MPDTTSTTTSSTLVQTTGTPTGQIPEGQLIYTDDNLKASPPSVRGEQAVSGDMPDPGSDDDTLKNSHQVGLRVDEDYEHPQPLNIADDVAKAEAARHGR